MVISGPASGGTAPWCSTGRHRRGERGRAGGVFGAGRHARRERGSDGQPTPEADRGGEMEGFLWVFPWFWVNYNDLTATSLE